MINTSNFGDKKKPADNQLHKFYQTRVMLQICFISSQLCSHLIVLKELVQSLFSSSGKAHGCAKKVSKVGFTRRGPSAFEIQPVSDSNWSKNFSRLQWTVKFETRNSHRDAEVGKRTRLVCSMYTTLKKG